MLSVRASCKKKKETAQQQQQQQQQQAEEKRIQETTTTTWSIRHWSTETNLCMRPVINGIALDVRFIYEVK